MRVCCNCAEEITDVSPQNDGYCCCCNEEVYTVETTKINAVDIEDEIYYFEYFDLYKQLDLIIDSIGSHKDKLKKLKMYIENEYWRICKR